jgi:DNA polymerase
VREHPLWCLDQKINDRGFKVDTALALGAIEAVKEIKVELKAEVALSTDGRVSSTQQVDATLQELLLEYGVKLPDLQASTIERRLEDPDLPDGVKELLANRLMMSTSSVSKYNRIMKAVSSDGRLRGSLQFCGAPRPQRWSGKLFQPQNLPRAPRGIASAG